jgi:hypothetical protein
VGGTSPFANSFEGDIIGNMLNSPSSIPDSGKPVFTIQVLHICCPYVLFISVLFLFQLTRLCHQLDKIWLENVGMVILFSWFAFLVEETFQFLTLENPLELGQKLNENPLELGQKLNENPLELGQKLNENPLELGQKLTENPLELGQKLNEDPLELGQKLTENPK